MTDMWVDRPSLLDGLRIVLSHTIGHLTPEERGMLLQLVKDLVKSAATGAVEGARPR